MALKKKNPLQDVFNKISDAIIITDLDYIIKAWNKAAEKIYGWKAEEIIGKSMVDTIKIEYRDQNFELVKRQFEEEGSWKGNVIQYNKNGKKIHVFSSVSIVKDDSETQNKIVAINQDLTERKQIKEKLKFSEQKYKLIVENAHEGIWMIDKEGYTNFVNHRMAEILEYSRSEMIGKHLFDFCDQNYRKIAKHNIERRKEGIREQHEFIFNKKSGEKVYANLVASPIFGEKEEYKGSVALISDKTEKRDAERKLKESEEMFRTLAEQSLVGLQIIQDMNVVYINEKAAKFSGLKVEEIKELSFQETLKFIHPDDLEKIKSQYKKRIENNPKFENSYQFRVINQDGRVKWIESLNRKIKYKGKDADMILLVDITDIKEAEKELKISEQNFRNAYDRANFYKDLFIHDINNILQVIKSSIELISQFVENMNIKEDFITFLNMIDKQAKKGEKLVLNIHRLSKLEEEKVDFELVDIFKILTNVINYIKNTYQDKNLKIIINSPFNEYILQANQLLEDVFQNLLINSITYNENQRIEIHINISEKFKKNKKYLKLEFIDNGIGIEEERKELIFQKGTKPSKFSKGLGFGLSLVKIIIEKYNGKIWVEDRVKKEPKRGSNFVILLPIKS